MLRHRKYKRPLAGKGFYYIYAMGATEMVKIKIWNRAPAAKLVYRPAIMSGGKQFINKYHVGDDGYVVQTKHEISFTEVPRIINEVWAFDRAKSTL